MFPRYNFCTHGNAIQMSANALELRAWPAQPSFLCPLPQGETTWSRSRHVIVVRLGGELYGFVDVG
jgi:hypothetical protein